MRQVLFGRGKSYTPCGAGVVCTFWGTSHRKTCGCPFEALQTGSQHSYPDSGLHSFQVNATGNLTTSLQSACTNGGVMTAVPLYSLGISAVSENLGTLHSDGHVQNKGPHIFLGEPHDALHLRHAWADFMKTYNAHTVADKVGRRG